MIETRAIEPGPFVAASRNAALIESAIESERPQFAPPAGVTGIGVPHHLLAADLLARAFWAASANRYDRIFLIAPDHFHKVRGHFSVSREPLETVLGPVPPDLAAVESLLAQDELFESARDVAHEHGIQSVAPFIRRFFPDTPTVALLASANAPPATWQEAARALGALVTDRTLVVQSTDYSHYLPLSEAIQRDQEAIATISAGNPMVVSQHLQPGHIDSLASQYLQLELQRQRLGGTPVVIANRNSVEYGAPAQSTTSYVVTVYVRDPAAAAVLAYPDQQRLFFAGDTLLGRYLAPVLQDPEAVRAIVDSVRRVTAGAPLVLNLEGVILDDPVAGTAPSSLLMYDAMAGPVLKRLGVVAAGLANNHSLDLGPLGLAETRKRLLAQGIAPMIHSEVHDLGGIRVLPLTFHRGHQVGPGVVDSIADLQRTCALAADPPLVAFVHWGTEYTNTPTEAEREAALALHACGIALVVGAHSHQASGGVEALAGGAVQLVFSLGNFLFDQSSPPSSGALLEVRAFRQGTLAARLVPIPNLFEVARHQHQGIDGR